MSKDDRTVEVPGSICVVISNDDISIELGFCIIIIRRQCYVKLFATLSQSFNLNELDKKNTPKRIFYTCSINLRQQILHISVQEYNASRPMHHTFVSRSDIIATLYL